MNIYSSKVRLNLASGGSIWAGLPGSSGHISKHLLRLSCVVLRSVNPPYHDFLQQLEKPGFESWPFQCSGCEQHIAMDAWGEGDLPRARPGKGWEGHKESAVLGNLLCLSMVWHPKKCQCQTQAVQTFMFMRTSLHWGEPRGSQPAWKPSEISFMLRCKAASNSPSPATREKP